MLWFVPEDIRITEVRGVEVGHGISRVVRPGPAPIVAESDVLFLALLVCRRVNGDQARAVLPVTVLAEAAGVIPIHHRTAGIHHIVAGILGQRHWQILPMHHVAAHGVPPVHMSPHIAMGVVLVEQVVLTLVKDCPIGIVHEVAWGREVVLRSPGLIV